MRDTQRKSGTGLIELLLAEPHRFEFFQAVRLLEQWLCDTPQEVPTQLRFRNRLSLAFPPSDIDAIDSSPGEIAITPAVMGLLGSSGALPYHYTERIAEYEQQEGDASARAFFDLFSNRSLVMFCLAWAKHRPECMRDEDGRDGFLAMLLSLSGVHLRPGGNIDSETFARYAILAAGRTASSESMAGMLTEYFGVPFHLEQLVGVWEKVPEQQQAQLGVVNCCLDAGVLLGDSVNRCDTRARIRIGPLCTADFERFLPDSEGAAALKTLLGGYCTAGVTFEVRLILRAEDVHGFSLDSSGSGGGARLGIDTFLLDGAAPCDRDDVNYLLQP